jgi:hypothetical protein
MYCRHRWRKNSTLYQDKKDDNKTQWICAKCNRHLLLNFWEQPEGASGGIKQSH